jgi:hypothetical protein
MTYSLPREKVLAVHDQDLEKVLEGLGILHKFKRGELKCKFCDRIITLENLHSIFPQSGDIKLVCDSYRCIRELSKLLREGEVSL